MISKMNNLSPPLLGEPNDDDSDDEVDDPENMEMDVVVVPNEEQQGEVNGDEEEEHVVVNDDPNGTYSLLSFCPTRWYSAWLVMLRFYSLFDALEALSHECERDNVLRRNGGREFLVQMERISKDGLSRVLHYLRPLVQAIDFFQSDDTINWDVVPAMENVRRFYDLHTGSGDIAREGYDTILSLKKGAVGKAFEARMNLFDEPYTYMYKLFTDEFARALPRGSGIDDERVQRFGESLIPELERYYHRVINRNVDGLVNAACNEALMYVTQYHRRVGITVSEYIRNNSHRYPYLCEIYRDLCSCPASSAAVERSFSVQGCILSPRRDRLSLMTTKELMIIRMNTILSEKYGWFEELAEVIENLLVHVRV